MRRDNLRQILVKLSSGFLATIEKENEGSSSADNYLRYTKLDQGKPANFALAEQDPLGVLAGLGRSQGKRFNEALPLP